VLLAAPVELLLAWRERGLQDVVHSWWQPVLTLVLLKV
jgi:hypothetical protein